MPCDDHAMGIAALEAVSVADGALVGQEARALEMSSFHETHSLMI